MTFVQTLSRDDEYNPMCWKFRFRAG